ncbi:hypothetical protein O3P69_005289 [Scylla paramamosain]|uniref:Uncharacterized protein n=1 Tax=Scylla paramamosain TaxID=85552 RepID=A0AAW0UCS6_SCYPA
MVSFGDGSPGRGEGSSPFPKSVRPVGDRPRLHYAPGRHPVPAASPANASALPGSQTSGGVSPGVAPRVGCARVGHQGCPPGAHLALDISSTTTLPPRVIQGGEGDISIYQAPFWNLACPEDLHEAIEGGRTMLGGSRRLHIHVSGRLVDTFPHKGGCFNQRLGGAERVSRHWVQSELGQVCPHSHAEALLARDRVGHGQRLTVAGSEQRPSDTPLRQEGVFLSHLLSPSVGGPAAFPALPVGRLKHRWLTREVNRYIPLLPRDLHRLVPPALHSWLRPWLRLGALRQSVPWSSHPPWITVATDASDIGWGFQSSWGDEACGGWSEERRSLHINLRELMMVREWLERYPEISGMSVHFDMDNVTPVQCVQRQDTARFRSTPDSVREHLRHSVTQEHIALCEACPGSGERLGDTLSRFSGDVGAVALTPTGTISAITVLDFLTWLADSTNRTPATVSAHYAALADLLRFGMDIRVPRRALSILRKGISSSREPRHQAVLAWSLHRVLQYLTFDEVTMEEEHFFQHAVFLLALATGYRALQLAAVTRHSSFSSLEEDCSALTLSPSPGFLAKNERADDMIGPLRIPSFLERGHLHLLWWVCAFKDYVESTERVSEDHLFYNSKSRKPLPPRFLARLLCRVIERADPGCAPHAHNKAHKGPRDIAGVPPHPLGGTGAGLGGLGISSFLQDAVSLPLGHSDFVCRHGNGSTPLVSGKKRRVDTEQRTTEG